LTHATQAGGEIDLEPLRQVLKEQFQPQDFQDAQELILGACQEAQHIYGYVPKEAAQEIADHLGTSINRVFGLLTFYADVRTEKPGKHVMLLCHGAACYVRGSARLIGDLKDKYGIDESDWSSVTTCGGQFSVQVINGCLGVCDLAPVIQVDHHDYYGHLDVERLNDVMAALKRGDAVEDKHGTD
jgi:NADH-quinone oxidoreductase subunit E